VLIGACLESTRNLSTPAPYLIPDLQLNTPPSWRFLHDRRDPVPRSSRRRAPQPLAAEPSVLPQIEWTGNNGRNFTQGRAGQAPQLFVVHVADSADGAAGARACANWFRNPQCQASTHFIVGGGLILQAVDLADMAWANGIWETGWNSANPVLADLRRRGLNPNLVTIAVECAGRPFVGAPAYLVDRDYQNLVALARACCDRYRIPKDRAHLIGHYEISAQSRANCPGPRFPWDRFVADVAGAGDILADDGITLQVQTPRGVFEITQGFRSWWLQDRTAWGCPLQNLVYTGDGDAWQPFEKGHMWWIKATGELRRG